MRDRFPIEADQLSQLRRLLGELETNRFYAHGLRAARLVESVDSLAAFRERMPFTTKAELVEDQRRNPPYGSNLTYPVERYTRLHQTSGTTAAPVRWLDTPESWQWMLDSWKRVFRAAGVSAEDRVLFAFSFGPFLGFWTAFEAAAQLGALCLPGGGMASAARLRMAFDNAATVLCCTPTYAIHLAEAASREGIDLASSAVRLIVVAGEPGGSIPAVRRRIESLWPGARVFDHHGMTEVGPVSYECPERPGTLLVMESAYLAEVIDPQTTAPLGEGQVGELVLTTLGRLGSPLLRYRTGDLVKPVFVDETGGGPGPFLALEGGILGRADDMVLVRGVNVYPGAVDQIIRADPRVAEYVVEIDGSGAMVQMAVSVEPVSGRASDGLAVAIEAALRNALSLRVPVRVVECGTLPRYEMKAKRWVRR